MFIVPPPSLSASSAPGHRQRHGQHDDEGIDEALELGREHEVDERQRQHEHEIDVARRLLVLARLAVVVEPRRGRQHLARRRFQRRDRLALRIARRDVGGDVAGATCPIRVSSRGATDSAHVDQVGELDHLPVRAAHVDLRQVVGVGAVDIGDLDDDVILLAVLLEAGDLPAAEHRLQRAADGGSTSAPTLAALARGSTRPSARACSASAASRRWHARALLRLGQHALDQRAELGILHRDWTDDPHRARAGVLARARAGCWRRPARRAALSAADRVPSTIACCLRSRSSHGFSCAKAMPCETIGLPETTKPRLHLRHLRHDAVDRGWRTSSM